MKNLKFILICLSGLLACQPGEPDIQPAPGPAVPREATPTETGKPIGAPVKKTIGPAGGTITTPGNVLSLVIPAGALSKDTTISIQPVENKAWGGTGLGYEMTPKNLELAKPAELVWNYTEQEVAGSAPEALGIAFQQPNQSWLGRRNVNVDKVQRKVSTPVTKLLPAAFYEQYYLTPGNYSIVPGQHLKIDVVFQEGNQENDDMLFPLNAPQILRKADVRNWQVNGLDLENKADPQLGTLNPSGTEASAGYLAPSRIPKVNDIAISVEVLFPGKTKVILFSRIKVEAANAFSFAGSKVDSAEVGTMTVAGNEFLQISLAERQLTGEKQAMIVLSMLPFPGAGRYSAADGDMIRVNATDGRGKTWSDRYYPKTGKKIVGPLEVQILYYDETKKLVEGVLSGTMHHYDERTDKHETTSVKARFKAASPY